MFSILLLGLLLGMRHAVEADHIAAVVALATRGRSIAQTMRLGAVWGLGHTLTLLLFGSIVLTLDSVMPERLAAGLELTVGFMLVLLGLDVLRRLMQERVHFHMHRHADEVIHLHAHAHGDSRAPHDSESHSHRHARGLNLRALFVGVMHGMAGSAALILLTLETVRSVPLELAYIVLFGAGSMIGMAALSAIIAVPLRYSAATLTRLHNGLKALIGGATVALGAALIYEIGIVDGLLT